MEDLILADASNDVIRNVLKWDTNKTTTALISKDRKKLGKTLQKPRRTFSKEYIEKIDSLIKEGKTTSEISKIMGESDPSRLYCLISKRKKIIKQNPEDNGGGIDVYSYDNENDVRIYYLIIFIEEL